MRFFAALLLILYAPQIWAQSDSAAIRFDQPVIDYGDLDESDLYYKSCEDARHKAKSDMKSGFMSIELVMGLTFKKIDFDFEDFYTNYLIVNYKIDRIITGCIVMPYQNCYFEEMNKAIIEKYGSSFLTNAEEVAKVEYEKFKTLNSGNRRKYIDFNYVYRDVDVRAEYIAGQEKFREKLRSKIDFSKFDFKGFQLDGFYAEVTVDELGNVVDSKVVSKYFPLEADTEIRNAIKEIGGWRPAILYGSKVKSVTGLSYVF